MRIEIANQMAAMERRQEATIARLLAAQAQAIDKERATLLATQRAETDRTIAALSSAINADLPARLADIMREQVTRALSSGGSVDRAARGQLDASFKTAFSKTLLPAFEAGVTNMLAQVHSALAAGMAQHVASHTRATEALGRSIDAAVVKVRCNVAGEVDGFWCRGWACWSISFFLGHFLIVLQQSGCTVLMLLAHSEPFETVVFVYNLCTRNHISVLVLSSTTR